ncbi:ARF GTPase-activating protein GIT2 [Collichthys lucidus]|uniref:ARF GTPase-activating protein GIT2 n=1 Tax=Collichthys lucidus TaxID=240159 RepID=A0A4U5V9E2_COLLU|nr:ARF GTPase-activating protein GIT2 [Collichthys lucidus]
MSKRVRSREVCADCSAPEPRWASVNRGVLICDECCSIHRGLGRHSSQVRHLTHSPWPSSQLQMVQTLYGNGANSIWEHSLLDPSSSVSGKRKANPQDRVHPNKTEFIKAKYQMLAYVHRMPCREDDSVTAKDLSKQLHSSVRTGNLETCLRLLSLGAQANFFHPVSEVEFKKNKQKNHPRTYRKVYLTLTLPRSSLCCFWGQQEKGNTPLHIAAKAGQMLQAELLAVYGADPGALDSSGKTPIDYARQAGHQELAERLVEIQYELTDRLTFYLCGRRPVQFNPFETGQKKFCFMLQLSNHQFEELAMDVYDEVDRRETDADNVELILQGIDSRHNSESQDNDQPDYDSVASDEDPVQEATCGDSCNDRRTKSSESSDLSDGPITVQEFMEVKSALTASEAKIQQLLKVNCHLSEELRLMQSKLNSLQTENTTLRWQAPSGQQHLQGPFVRHPPRGGRAMSMYETGSSPRQYPHRVETARHEDGVILQPFPTNGCSLEGQSMMLENDYDTTPNHSELEETGSPLPASDAGEPGEEGEEDATLPCTEDVICKTEQITKNIQELLRAAQETKHESFLPCSEKICMAVTEMAALFPKRPSSETVRGSLCLLTSSASRLHGECQKAAEHNPCPSDIQLVTQQVIQCAYDIAKAAKQLVTVTTKENNN